MKLSQWQDIQWQNRASVRRERTRDFQRAKDQRREQDRQVTAAAHAEYLKRLRQPTA